MTRMKKISLSVATLLLSRTLSAPLVSGDAPVFVEPHVTSQWDVFIEALIWVESGGNEKAIGTKDDYGVLQITPVYVEEANRIVGYEKYYHEECFDRDYSIEIFNVVNGYYNPDKDFDIAIKLHNPKAGEWYRERILNKYNEYGSTLL